MQVEILYGIYFSSLLPGMSFLLIFQHNLSFYFQTQASLFLNTTF